MMKINLIGKIAFSFFAVIILNLSLAAQQIDNNVAILLAKETLKMHGGEKLTKLKNLTLKGSADVFFQGQSLPAAFVIVSAGEKYRFDVQSAMFNFSQKSDGQNTSSSVPGIAMPPINRIGMLVLPHIEEKGFMVSALSDKLAKKKGFRVTTPEGYYTDFIVDEKTSLIKEYQSIYEINGRMISTAVSIDKYKEIEGLLINEKFSQRLDVGAITAHIEFKAKEIILNSEIEESIFTSQ